MADHTLAPLKPAIESYLPMGRAGLLPALHAAQKIYGWIPEPVAAEIARSLRVPLADAHGVIEFYSLFYNEPTSRRVIRVCADVACALKGARSSALEQLCSQHGLRPRQTTGDLSLTIEPSPCLGLCEHAPAVWTMDEWAIDHRRWNEGGNPVQLVHGLWLRFACSPPTAATAQHRSKQYGDYDALKKAHWR
jgi:NADH:ubiquinone oxidoreductase subunit E